MTWSASTTTVAIACGGTGGHLFPGLAVAENLRTRGCAVTLLVSPKEVDEHAVSNVSDMKVEKLPAVGFQHGNRIGFFTGFLRSFRLARQMFRATPPDAVLAMGGFTSAPPILAAKFRGARTFIHESNAIPGRANRLLSRLVDEAFVGFARGGCGLKARRVTTTGTPVRSSFQSIEPSICRRRLGLVADHPVMVVTGGSQGARGVNELIVASLPLFAKAAPDLQWLHLTGLEDFRRVKQAYAAAKIPAVVYPFFDQMHLALGAASVAISRAGGSSLAELAASVVPCILVPYPAAVDNHQFYNAKEFADTGAACLLEQHLAQPDRLLKLAQTLLHDQKARSRMQESLRGWQSPRAAEQIADAILNAVESATEQTAPLKGQPSDSGPSTSASYVSGALS